MQKLMGDEGWGGPCFSLLTPSVCDSTALPSSIMRELVGHSLTGIYLYLLCVKPDIGAPLVYRAQFMT